jgi:hypothetical protein
MNVTVGLRTPFSVVNVAMRSTATLALLIAIAPGSAAWLC